MKICLYSPYVPKHVGGGEKYFFDVARLLAEKHDVSVMVPSLLGDSTPAKLQAKYEAFLGVSLAKVKFIEGPLGSSAPWWQKLWWTRQFQVLYVVSDGSLFFSLAGRNILHLQIPFLEPKTSWIERLKLANWQLKNANSYFTKQVIEKSWQTKIEVVHWPMVEVPSQNQKISLAAKKPLILHVGRFFTHLHAKRQDALVEFFKQMLTDHPRTMKDWELVLVGTVEDEAYVQKVKAMAKGYPIRLIHTATRAELWQLYAQAQIYWHATGYQVDQELQPANVEHFGISTVEAMAMGCAPVVINKGGQPEVVGPDLADLLWNNAHECQAKTIELLQSPETLKQKQKLAQTRATLFTEARFKAALEMMIGEPV